MNIKSLKIEGSTNYFTLRLNFKYALTTTIILAITTVAILCYPKTDYSNEALFAKYYEQPDFPARGGNEEIGMFFKAVYAMKEHQYQDAMKDFRKVLNKCGQMHDHAQWYYMLCLLKTNSSEETINAYLCDIVRKRGQYSDRATKILYYKSKQSEKEQNP